MTACERDTDAALAADWLLIAGQLQRYVVDRRRKLPVNIVWDLGRVSAYMDLVQDAVKRKEWRRAVDLTQKTTRGLRRNRAHIGTKILPAAEGLRARTLYAHDTAARPVSAALKPSS